MARYARPATTLSAYHATRVTIAHAIRVATTFGMALIAVN